MLVVSNAWKDIVKTLLSETDYKELEEFSYEISQRLAIINKKMGKKLENLFIPEVVCYLPKCNEQMERELA